MTSQTSKAHSFTPNANKSEFNCSKPFLCKGIDGGNPAARNLSTFVPVDQSVHWCCLDVDCKIPMYLGRGGSHLFQSPIKFTVESEKDGSLLFLDTLDLVVTAEH